MKIKLEIIHRVPHLLINSKKFNLTTGFSMHLALEELRLLNTGLEIKFESFSQLKSLIDRINNLKFIDLTAIQTEELLKELKRRTSY